MTPHGYAMSLENAADMLAEALWEQQITVFGHTTFYVDPDTQKALRRVQETIGMILEGDIRSPQDMAAEVEGRVSE